ncbi:MAG: fumarate hydratase [Candidatus Altiarchaeota archaeon]|nr:fumarate hydratase [Candidatus Altiarchaeota archaeon]
MITKKAVSDTAEKLLLSAETVLPEDVVKALRRAYKTETGKIAKIQLKAILDNVKNAKENSVPICQDTGLPAFYVGIGDGTGIDHRVLREGLVEGVRKATDTVPLRPNVVHPLTRKNSGDNTGTGFPAIDIELLEGKDYIEITAFPKGAGSENMSALKMLNPSDGVGGLKRFVMETVASAGGNPCPPTIVGVGIGGTADAAMRLSKKALLREIGSVNRDDVFAELERELLEDINKLGIGPMGLGGKTTALAVHMEYACCHTASLPVAVSMQCWAGRRAKARIYEKRVVYL